MALLKATRAAQYPLVQEFTFNFDDTMANASGVTKDFGKTTVAETNTFVIGKLPVNAVVISGEVVTETAFDTAGLDITVGDTAVTNRYLASTDLKGAGRQAVTPTGYRGGEDLVITVQCDDVCTQGKATVRVMYTIQGRANEVQPS